MATIGILPLGRPTFDVAFAEKKLAQMLAVLDASGHRIAGPRSLLFDAITTRAALDEIAQARIDRLLLLQVTFTDASMTVAAAGRFGVPLAIWAVPEPRTGGRLRLNAFCGLNLASHALGRNHRAFGWLYADPAGMDSGSLDGLLSGRRDVARLEPHPAPVQVSPGGKAAAAALSGSRIAHIGARPEGFDTCAYDDDAIAALGASVERIELATLFEAARHVPASKARALRQKADAVLTGLDTVDQPQLERSLRLKLALDGLRETGGFDAFAIRCWPETFTEYGGAVCGPVSMLGEARVPCACEADVYGALTQILLQKVADAPVFLADLVDMDTRDDTGVVWHCGQAPISMADPDARAAATVHTNRKMPLLYEFSLKPGRVTLMRLSQAHGTPRVVLAGGEMLKRDMAFTGTSGVVRFDRPASEVLNDVMNSGLEHHMALAYGEHRPVLRSAAAALKLPLIEL